MNGEDDRFEAAGHAIDRIEGPAVRAVGAVGQSKIALSIAAGMVRSLHDSG